MWKKIIIYLVLGLGLASLLSCSSATLTHETVTDEEAVTLVRIDTEKILNHLNALAQATYGNNYLADLLESDVVFEVKLGWYEDGKPIEKKGFYQDGQYEPFKDVWKEFTEKTQYHIVRLNREVSPDVYKNRNPWILLTQ